MPNLNWRGKEKLETSNKTVHYKFYPFQLNEVHFPPVSKSVQFNEEFIKKREILAANNLYNEKIWKNLLIWGENKAIMFSLLDRFSEKINLIYIDPPFASGGDYKLKIPIGDDDAFEISKAYTDSWKGGIDSYLNYLYERLILMKKLLSKDGSIYVHLDWHVSHYIKIMLDEIFGSENFRNEIIWVYPAASAQTKRFFIRSFDVILYYTKSDDYIFNDDPQIYMEYSDRVKNALKKDELGTFYYRGGSHNGKKLSQKVYVRKKGIFPRDFWYDIPYVRANTLEYQGFSTQKPERLLKRIILASSKENDLVADFFCGSGTTLAVAEKLRRRWIGCDLKKHNLHICRKRILDISNSYDMINWKKIYNKQFQPFSILNLKDRQKQNYYNSIPQSLIQITSNNKIKISKEKPEFEVIVYKEQDFIKIQLQDYKIPQLNLLNRSFKSKITKFSDWIDYWAIDTNYQDDTFISDWLSYRTHKKRELKLTSNPIPYNNSKGGTIAVKVVNIFGSETLQFY